MTDLGEQPKPNWKEAFQGKDVVGGETLVNNLLYEGVGIPVYSHNYNERKTRLLVDREIGEEDITIRQKEERNNRLLGLLVPTGQKNEFLYLGINESGFVFQTGDRNAYEFHKDTSPSYETSRNRFGEWASWLEAQDFQTSPLKIILKEETDPGRFSEIVVSSVQKERGVMQTKREKRANVREDLLNKLFPQS